MRSEAGPLMISGIKVAFLESAAGGWRLGVARR